MILEERFLALILKFSNDVPSLIQKYLLPFNLEFFVTPKIQDIARELIIYYNKGKERAENFIFDFDEFIKSIKEKQLKEYANFLILLGEKEFLGLREEEIENELQRVVKQLKKEQLADRLKEIETKLKQAEKDNKKEETDKLTQELNKLTHELSKLI